MGADPCVPGWFMSHLEKCYQGAKEKRQEQPRQWVGNKREAGCNANEVVGAHSGADETEWIKSPRMEGRAGRRERRRGSPGLASPRRRTDSPIWREKSKDTSVELMLESEKREGDPTRGSQGGRGASQDNPCRNSGVGVERRAGQSALKKQRDSEGAVSALILAKGSDEKDEVKISRKKHHLV